MHHLSKHIHCTFVLRFFHNSSLLGFLKVDWMYFYGVVTVVTFITLAKWTPLPFLPLPFSREWWEHLETVRRGQIEQEFWTVPSYWRRASEDPPLTAALIGHPSSTEQAPPTWPRPYRLHYPGKTCLRNSLVRNWVWQQMEFDTQCLASGVNTTHIDSAHASVTLYRRSVCCVAKLQFCMTTVTSIISWN